jgi:hypothetical protein
VSEALGKAWKTLDEGFADCDTQKRRLGELYIGNNFFAMYFLSDTQQTLCQVPLGTQQREVVVTTPGDGDGARACAECPPSDTRQWLSLCRVSVVLTIGKEAPHGPLYHFGCRAYYVALGKSCLFVECLTN